MLWFVQLFKAPLIYDLRPKTCKRQGRAWTHHFLLFGYIAWEINLFFSPFLFLSVLFSPLWGGWSLAGYDVMSHICSLDTFTHVIGPPTLSIKPDENTAPQPRWGRLAKLLSVFNQNQQIQLNPIDFCKWPLYVVVLIVTVPAVDLNSLHRHMGCSLLLISFVILLPVSTLTHNFR